MTEPSRPAGAVFLSYAREDGEAARRIAEALRGFGIETWFDVTELRGGDAWDAKIKRQIRECSLFIAIVSANTQARGEGYFRREWKLAVERTHDMSENRAFIVPVLVDDTKESAADVPEQFLKVQFTRLPGGEPTPQFVEQVKRLLQHGAVGRDRLIPPTSSPARSGDPALQKKPRSPGWTWGALAAVAVGVVVALYVSHSPPAAAPAVSPASPAPSLATPPTAADAKSIAVLPFVNMSTDADQGFFADGLSEELLNLLAKVPALQVTSRSSAFSFKGKSVELSEIAQRLHVAHILEGSVRKAGSRVRITAQLIDARTDRHLWSETYDRSLDDIFAVQDEIAAAVVAQLKVSLLGEAPKTRTTDPKAYALFLQARQLFRQATADSFAQAVELSQQALAIDPNFVAALVTLAGCYTAQADYGQRSNEEGYRLARESLEKALAIDPDSAEAHTVFGRVISATTYERVEAARHYERALALEPTNTILVTQAMGFARGLGRWELTIRMGEYVVAHDPVNAFAHAQLGGAYTRAGRYDEGIASMRTALRLSPGRGLTHYAISNAMLAKGDFPGALAEILQEPQETWRLDGLAQAYHVLGRKAESDAALATLIAKYEKESSWNIAYVCAYRGEADRCFEWLEKAMVYRDPGLSLTAVTWSFDNVHSDPRWLPFLRKIGLSPEQLAAIKFDVKLPEK